MKKAKYIGICKGQCPHYRFGSGCTAKDCPREV